ncbi:hypothetical protein [Pseudomonas palleroniana]|uniref:hypothetical protein n=1 Tax=Pseudomonas palleroniana TaxID=191390 RepID=UPI0018E6D07D|nr:hypothetical protein [Pseudomonas palleroniana]MBI6911666.1 hypothetical protein [Pseudomonas palleroniana]
MPFVVIPQPFPNSPLQTQFATEEEAGARAQQMVEQSPKQPVYVAELKTMYQGSVTVTTAAAVTQPQNSEQG